jgi:hypothetical protein
VYVLAVFAGIGYFGVCARLMRDEIVEITKWAVWRASPPIEFQPSVMLVGSPPAIELGT